MVCETKQMTLGKDKVGKVRHEGTTLGRTDLSPAEITGYRALAATANFLAIDRRDLSIAQKN